MRQDLETTDEAGAAESAALVDVLEPYAWELDPVEDEPCGCGHDPACPHP